VRESFIKIDTQIMLDVFHFLFLVGFFTGLAGVCWRDFGKLLIKELLTDELLTDEPLTDELILYDYFYIFISIYAFAGVLAFFYVCSFFC
jgi:hypothetical protein